MRSVPVIAAAALLISPVIAATNVPAPTPKAEDASALDGMGPYKFRMTVDQVRSIGVLTWRQSARPRWMPPTFSSSLGAQNIDQFGFHFENIGQEFDMAGGL